MWSDEKGFEEEGLEDGGGNHASMYADYEVSHFDEEWRKTFTKDRTHSQKAYAYHPLHLFSNLCQGFLQAYFDCKNPWFASFMLNRWIKTVVLKDVQDLSLSHKFICLGRLFTVALFDVLLNGGDVAITLPLTEFIGVSTTKGAFDYNDLNDTGQKTLHAYAQKLMTLRKKLEMGSIRPLVKKLLCRWQTMVRCVPPSDRRFVWIGFFYAWGTMMDKDLFIGSRPNLKFNFLHKTVFSCLRVIHNTLVDEMTLRMHLISEKRFYQYLNCTEVCPDIKDKFRCLETAPYLSDVGDKRKREEEKAPDFYQAFHEEVALLVKDYQIPSTPLERRTAFHAIFSSKDVYKEKDSSLDLMEDAKEREDEEDEEEEENESKSKKQKETI